MQSGSRADKSGTGHDFRNDLIALACLTVFTVVVFSSTIFSAGDISRIGTVAHRDTLFGRLARGSVDPMDTSIYQEHGPNYFLAEQVIASGNMPLWNPYLGFGCPLWSDPQVLAFSPMTWLQAPFASMRLYNMLMVFYLWISTVSVYVFARLLRISPAGAVLSAISFAFCPYQMYMVEWNRFHDAFFAFPCLGFALLWRRGNLAAVVVCSILCVAVVVSGHAVPSFFSILLGSLMYFGLCYLSPQGSSPADSNKASWLPVRNFLLTGILTFLISAPLVVPFLFTMGVSDCFKGSLAALRYVVRGTALLPSLLYPFHGAGSPYIGAVSLLLSCSALLIAGKNRAIVAVFSALAILTVLSMIRFGPFDLLFSLNYLNWFMLVYAMPGLLVILAILAGLGYDALIVEERKMRSAAIMAVVAALPLSMPFLFRSMHLTANQMMLNDWIKSMAVTSSGRLRELIFVLLTIVLAFALAKLRADWRSRVALLLIVLNVLSLAFIFKNSLPARPAFAYEKVEPLGFLSEQKRRVLSMGRHVLVPNTGQIFAVSSLLSFMPTHPAGVIGYLKKLGVTIEGVGQYAESPLTKLVDIASVKYAVCSEPVLSVQDKIPEPVDIASQAGVSFGPSVKLAGYSLSIDARNLDAAGKLRWNRVDKDKSIAALSYVSMLVKEDGSLVWVGDRHPLADRGKEKGSLSSEWQTIVTGVIPQSLKAGEPVCLILQVLDMSTGQLVQPENVPESMRIATVAGSVALKRFLVPDARAAGQNSWPRHFRLLKETVPEMVRVYENTGCLPEAYLVFKTKKASGIDEALSEMMKADFDPESMAIIDGLANADTAGGNGGPAIVEAKVSRPSVNEVVVEVKAERPAFLILTDVFFPGWKATVDGKASEIYRANAVLRAVKVEAGEHKIRFVYDPLDVKLGFLLFVIGIAAALALLLFGKRAGLEKTEPGTP